MGKLFTEEELKIARMCCSQDPYVLDLTSNLRNLYAFNLPVEIDVFLNGSVSISLSKVCQEMSAILKDKLKQHVLKAYPPLAYLYAPIKLGSGTSDDWIEIGDVPPREGEYFVITPNEYAIKAMHWGENVWQIDNVPIKDVTHYRHLPPPPSGINYVETSV